MKLKNDASKLEVRGWYDDDLATQWFKITDFDPENVEQRVFDFDDGTYLCFNDVPWAAMKWEYRILDNDNPYEQTEYIAAGHTDKM